MQTFIARVNCLDCIDRTNVILARIGEGYLNQVQDYTNKNVNMLEKKLELTQ